LFSVSSDGAAVDVSATRDDGAHCRCHSLLQSVADVYIYIYIYICVYIRRSWTVRSEKTMPTIVLTVTFRHHRTRPFFTGTAPAHFTNNLPSVFDLTTSWSQFAVASGKTIIETLKPHENIIIDYNIYTFFGFVFPTRRLVWSLSRTGERLIFLFRNTSLLILSLSRICYDGILKRLLFFPANTTSTNAFHSFYYKI